MKAILSKAVMLALGLALVACSKSEGEKPATDKGAEKAASAGAVSVPADGKKFEPPIKPEQLPSGAWYCDMGTVHYAQMEEGDKTCPVCKMKLKQKP